MSVFALNACSGCPMSGVNPEGAISVVVQTIVERQSSPQVTVFGVINPSNRVDLQFPRPIKIKTVSTNVGDSVAAGAPLFTLSDDDLTLQLNQLRAQKKEYDAAPSDAYGKATEATLERIKTDIAVVEHDLANQTVTSPIAGQVTSSRAAAGMHYAAKDVVMTIATMDPVTLVFPISIDDAQGIAVGTPLTIKLEDSTLPALQSAVSYTGPTVNPVSKTFDAWATLPNPTGLLKINMRATVEFTSSITHKVFVVPAASLTLHEHNATLFLVKNGIARRTAVVIRQIIGEEAILDSGVQSGDLVIARGWEKLQDGSSVDLRR